MQTNGFAGKGFHDTWEALGENALGAGRYTTEELTDMENEPNGIAAPRQIGGHTRIATVDSERCRGTLRANGTGLFRAKTYRERPIA